MSDKGGTLRAAIHRNRPHWFAVRSIRGLLDTMPAQDVSFRGISFGWKAIGVVDFDRKRESCRSVTGSLPGRVSP